MVNDGRATTPWYRGKPPAQIVESALIQIAKKKDAHCPSCVEAYVALARRNGASERDINTALGLPD